MDMYIYFVFMDMFKLFCWYLDFFFFSIHSLLENSDMSLSSSTSVTIVSLFEEEDEQKLGRTNNKLNLCFSMSYKLINIENDMSSQVKIKHVFELLYLCYYSRKKK